MANKIRLKSLEPKKIPIKLGIKTPKFALPGKSAIKSIKIKWK